VHCSGRPRRVLTRFECKLDGVETSQFLHFGTDMYDCPFSFHMTRLPKNGSSGVTSMTVSSALLLPIQVFCRAASWACLRTTRRDVICIRKRVIRVEHAAEIVNSVLRNLFQDAKYCPLSSSMKFHIRPAFSEILLSGEYWTLVPSAALWWTGRAACVCWCTQWRRMPL
jgi:hypothetical protein